MKWLLLTSVFSYFSYLNFLGIDGFFSMKDRLPNYYLYENGFKYQWPVLYSRITSKFGYRIHPIFKRREFHKGVDFAQREGVPILAVDSGFVVKIGYEKNGFGLYVVQKLLNGRLAFYAHCYKVMAAEGDFIEKGQIIALLGNTGRSTGPHLHLGIKEDNKWVNPLKFF